ncbi:DUF6452 family protein [Chitinophaga lutea]
MMRNFLLIACLAAGLLSCDDDTKVCDVDTRTEVRGDFVYFRDSTDMNHDTTFRAVTLYAFGKDSIYRNSAVGGIQFQLDRNADSSRFQFRTDTLAVPDTLIFRYKRQPHFVSAGCGVVMYFNIDTIVATRHVIKSVTINQPAITTGNETNFTLHF